MRRDNRVLVPKCRVWLSASLVILTRVILGKEGFRDGRSRNESPYLHFKNLTKPNTLGHNLFHCCSHQLILGFQGTGNGQRPANICSIAFIWKESGLFYKTWKGNQKGSWMRIVLVYTFQEAWSEPVIQVITVSHISSAWLYQCVFKNLKTTFFATMLMREKIW